MPYTQSEILEHSKRIRRSPRCLRYWIAEGCDLKNAASVEAFLQAGDFARQTSRKSESVAAAARRRPERKVSVHRRHAFSRSAMATCRLLESEAQQPLWSDWSTRKRKATGDYRRHWLAAIRSKFRLRRNSGCDARRHCAGWILRLRLPVGRRKTRSRFERLKMRSPRQPNVPSRSGICFLLLTPCC